MKTLFLALTSVVVTYLLFVFVDLKPNVFDWSPLARMLSIYVALIIYIVLTYFNKNARNDKAP